MADASQAPATKTYQTKGVNSETDETSQDDTYTLEKKFQIGTHFRFGSVAMVTGT